jgi:hypothetical protein
LRRHCGGLPASGGTDGQVTQAANNRAESNAARLLGLARLKLVETGTRNRLIHSPRGNKRSRSDQVFTHLVRDNKLLRFLAAEEIVELHQEAASRKLQRLVSPKTICWNGLHSQVSPKCRAARQPCLSQRAPDRSTTSGFSPPNSKAAGARRQDCVAGGPRSHDHELLRSSKLGGH